jgi:dipeptidyl aminopeptidase/acylaminoacyl peptidase
LSPDGTWLAYASTDEEMDGRTVIGPCDLYRVPLGGGRAEPIAGASDPDVQEYYPAISPDGRFIAFTRGCRGCDTYDQPQAEIYVVPAEGGTIHRLAANDPARCSGRSSPGITNSWPKWAPEAADTAEGTGYMITFSSRRRDGVHPQVYVAPFVVGDDGSLHGFPALHLPGQQTDTGNHTPAWTAIMLE